MKRKESRGLHYSRDYPAPASPARDTLLKPNPRARPLGSLPARV